MPRYNNTKRQYLLSLTADRDSSWGTAKRQRQPEVRVFDTSGRLLETWETAATGTAGMPKHLKRCEFLVTVHNESPY